MSDTSPGPSLWQQVFTRSMLVCIFTGFASGMPLYLLLQLVPAWLKDGGVSLTDIGLFALVGLPYSWKFVWAPLLDRYFIAGFGRRRTWLLPTQLGLLFAIAALGFLHPQEQLQAVIVLSFIIAALSATQDVALDAYRRELLADNELGLGNSIHVNAYRLSGLVPGSLSLILSDLLPWETVFIVTALFMLAGIGLTLAIREPAPPAPKNLDFISTIIDPFREFIERNGLGMTVKILLFMLLYKLGDNMATALSTPFYMDIGFSKTEIGMIAKHAALWPMIVGGMLGGILMLKIGINRALWLFGVVQLLTILGFAVLAEVGHNLVVLAVVIAMEYLGVGLGGAAFIAFIAKSTSPLYAGTQMALLTAFAALPRTIASAFTGYLVEWMGWTEFFLFCTLLAVPGMLMLFWVAPYNRQA